MANLQISTRGSSPRMRGALHDVRGRLDLERIIPADAGSTRPWPTCRYPHGDHPRGCGEHYMMYVVGLTSSGSSPRMRGARGHGQPADIHTGIIPADAGSTPYARRRNFENQDHPRGCGEHRPLVLESSPVMGSSPRMRGAQKTAENQSDDTRIIPADAGSTERPAERHSDSEDHPRGCGEHACQSSFIEIM